MRWTHRERIMFALFAMLRDKDKKWIIAAPTEELAEKFVRDIKDMEDEMNELFNY